MNTQKLNQAISLLNEILIEQNNGKQKLTLDLYPAVANLKGLSTRYKKFASALFVIHEYRTFDATSKEVKLLMVEHDIERLDNWARNLVPRGIIKMERTKMRNGKLYFTFLKEIPKA